MEEQLSGSELLDDAPRIAYLKAHLQALKQALTEDRFTALDIVYGHVLI